MAPWKPATAGILLLVAFVLAPTTVAEEDVEPFVISIQSFGFGDAVDEPKADQQQDRDVVRDALPFLFSGPLFDEGEYEQGEDAEGEEAWTRVESGEPWQLVRASPVRVVSLRHTTSPPSLATFGRLLPEDRLNDWMDRQLSVFDELFGGSEGLFGGPVPAVRVHVMEPPRDEEEDTVRCLDAVAEARFLSAMRDLHQLQANVDALPRFGNPFVEPRVGDEQLLSNSARGSAPPSTAWFSVATALLAALSLAGTAAGCYCCCSSYRSAGEGGSASYPYGVSQPLLSKNAASEKAAPKDSIVVAADAAEYINVEYVPLKGEQTP